MPAVVIFATGSPIIVDLEESLLRAGITLQAGISNRLGESYLSDPMRELTVTAVDAEVTRFAHLIALFGPTNRQCAAREAERLGFRRPFTLIDPTVAAPRSLQCDAGVYVNAGCSLGAASEFGAFVFINRGAAIGHHARLGRFVSIGPGAILGGQVSIGNGSLIGAGAVVLPRVTIGDNAVVGAGAVVVRDVECHTMVVGNPARVVKTDIAGHHGATVD